MSVYLRVNFRARRHLRLVFILATLLAVFIGVQSTLEKFLTGNYIQGGRVDYWANALAMFRDFPLFGTGLGTFPYAYFLYGRETGWVEPRPQRIRRVAGRHGGIGVCRVLRPAGRYLFSLCCACGSPAATPRSSPWCWAC